LACLDRRLYIRTAQTGWIDYTADGRWQLEQPTEKGHRQTSPEKIRIDFGYVFYKKSKIFKRS
jgi:hypothetical protein